MTTTAGSDLRIRCWTSIFFAPSTLNPDTFAFSSFELRLSKRGNKMKTLKNIVWFIALLLVFGGASLLVPENAAADGLRVNKRVESRQDRRGDRRENTTDGVKDRHEFREKRRDCVGDGPDCRSENRQDKRQDRQERTVDRMQDRGNRLDKRF
jgi:hypothetical protein